MKMNKKVIISIIIILVIIIGSVFYIFSFSVSFRPTAFYMFQDYSVLKGHTDLPMISRFDDGNTVVERLYLSGEIRPYKFEKGNFYEKITDYSIINNDITVGVYRLSDWPNRLTTSNQDSVVEEVIIENIEMQLCYYDESNILSIRHLFIDNDLSVRVGIKNIEDTDKDDFIQDNKETLITIMSEYINVIN